MVPRPSTFGERNHHTTTSRFAIPHTGIPTTDGIVRGIFGNSGKTMNQDEPQQPTKRQGSYPPRPQLPPPNGVPPFVSSSPTGALGLRSSPAEPFGSWDEVVAPDGSFSPSSPAGHSSSSPPAPPFPSPSRTAAAQDGALQNLEETELAAKAEDGGAEPPGGRHVPPPRRPPPPPPSMPRESSQFLPLRSCDVICGRSSLSHAHPGNKAYQALVHAHRGAYRATDRRDVKAQITHRVVELVHQTSGKFLVRVTAHMEGDPDADNDGSGPWVEADAKAVHEKVSHALRSVRDPDRPRIRKPRKRPRNVSGGGEIGSAHNPTPEEEEAFAALRYAQELQYQDLLRAVTEEAAGRDRPRRLEDREIDEAQDEDDDGDDAPTNDSGISSNSHGDGRKPGDWMGMEEQPTTVGAVDLRRPPVAPAFFGSPPRSWF